MKGINPLVSSTVAIVLVLASTLIAVNTITPMIKEDDNRKYIEAKQIMSNIDSLIRELYYESTGAMRVIDVDLKDRKLIISGKEDKLKIQMDARLFDPGTKFKEENLIISTGPFVKAYESDVNGDGTPELILENDDILFAVNKFGNSTNYATVNTSLLIAMIKNKRLGINITPTSGIYINNANDYGSGYTELTEKGDHLLSSSIRLVMNTTTRYEALFSLAASDDFIDLVIKVR